MTPTEFRALQEKSLHDSNSFLSELLQIFIGVMQTTNHILAKEGILTSFAIAKRITPLDVKQLREKVKGLKPSPLLLQELLTKKIVDETQQAFESKKIPGLMVKEILNENEEKKRIMELTYFASIMAKKMTDNHVGKYHACYVINAVVNMLGLTEEDFDEFHRKFSRFKEGRTDDIDSDDTDSGDQKFD